MCGGGGGGGGGGGSPQQPAKKDPGAPSVVAGRFGGGGRTPATAQVGSGRSQREARRNMMGGNRQNYKVNLSVANANVGGDGSNGLNIPSSRS